MPSPKSARERRVGGTQDGPSICANPPAPPKNTLKTSRTRNRTLWDFVTGVLPGSAAQNPSGVLTNGELRSRTLREGVPDIGEQHHEPVSARGALQASGPRLDPDKTTRAKHDASDPTTTRTTANNPSRSPHVGHGFHARSSRNVPSQPSRQSAPHQGVAGPTAHHDRRAQRACFYGLLRLAAGRLRRAAARR